jgi:hypothetical protein
VTFLLKVHCYTEDLLFILIAVAQRRASRGFCCDSYWITILMQSNMTNHFVTPQVYYATPLALGPEGEGGRSCIDITRVSQFLNLDHIELFLCPPLTLGVHPLKLDAHL